MWVLFYCNPGLVVMRAEDRDTVIFGAIIRQQELVCATICFPKLGSSSNVGLAISTIEVASVINRKGLARAGSWFMTEG